MIGDNRPVSKKEPFIPPEVDPPEKEKKWKTAHSAKRGFPEEGGPLKCHPEEKKKVLLSRGVGEERVDWKGYQEGFTAVGENRMLASEADWE